ncbi:hypothetical protein EWH99_08300 [Sporolactobacillus sp. THM7-7]|nr:hypothetical protein EWH99_08300 [Sporolactobacillus sp. THM7-7]
MKSRDDLLFPPGTQLLGKWHGRRYRIIRRLGSGSQGTVYLAREGGRKVAVKMAKDRASLTSEINVLKNLDQLLGEPLGPSLFDSDDWAAGGRTISFCAMEYLNGESLAAAMRRKAFDWTAVYMLQLLKDLDRLHRAGYIFGDLKPENIILLFPGHTIRCLDFGGATRIGRSVREYTAFYDRGYWGLGTRKAEPGYDLFACGMMMIYAALGREFEKSDDGRRQLFQLIQAQSRLAPYRLVLARAISGEYVSADQMRRELLRCIMDKKTEPAMSGRYQSKAKKETGQWVRAWFAASLIMTAYILFVYVYMM